MYIYLHSYMYLYLNVDNDFETFILHGTSLKVFVYVFYEKFEHIFNCQYFSPDSDWYLMQLLWLRRHSNNYTSPLRQSSGYWIKRLEVYPPGLRRCVWCGGARRTANWWLLMWTPSPRYKTEVTDCTLLLLNHYVMYVITLEFIYYCYY